MPLKAAPKPDTLDWSGFYLGGHVGYAWGRSDWTAVPTGTNGQPVAGSLNFYQPFNAWDRDGELLHRAAGRLQPHAPVAYRGRG